jgi:hypothetical protein
MKHLKPINIDESISTTQEGVYLVVSFSNEYNSVRYFNRLVEAISYFNDEFIPESKEEWDEMREDRSEQSLQYWFAGILRLKPGGKASWPEFHDWGSISNNEECEIVLNLREMLKHGYPDNVFDQSN